MSDKENDRIELDANPFAIEVANNSNSATELVETENNSIEIYNNASNAISTVVNNNMLVNNQHASSTNISFEGCNGITFGNILNFGTLAHHPQTITTVAELPIDMEESIAYRKTPTIKAMMESTQRLNDKYLDIFCAKLGHKYQAISTYLKIDEVDIKQAVEDHKLYGFSEVLFQILSKYFQLHNQFATVGWLTRFLWKNHCKQNVWAIKELWKLLRELDEDVSYA